MTKRRAGAARKRNPASGSAAAAGKPGRKKSAAALALVDSPARPGDSAEAAAFGDMRLEFRPFWNIKSKEFSTYAAVPVSVRGGETVTGYHHMLPRGFGKELTLALDRELLSRTVAAMSAENDADHRTFAVTSLHALTVQDATSAEEYYAACRRIPDTLRERLMFEIVDVDLLRDSEEGIGIARALAGLGAGVFGRASIENITLSYFTLMRLTAIGFDLSDDEHDEAEVMAHMEEIAEAAEKSKLSCFARGVTSVSLTSAAVAAGILYIEGAKIKRPDDDGAGTLKVVPFDINDMYASLFGA